MSDMSDRSDMMPGRSSNSPRKRVLDELETLYFGYTLVGLTAIMGPQHKQSFST